MNNCVDPLIIGETTFDLMPTTKTGLARTLINTQKNLSITSFLFSRLGYILEGYQGIYKTRFMQLFRIKLGLTGVDEVDALAAAGRSRCHEALVAAAVAVAVHAPAAAARASIRRFQKPWPAQRCVDAIYMHTSFALWQQAVRGDAAPSVRFGEATGVGCG